MTTTGKSVQFVDNEDAPSEIFSLRPSDIYFTRKYIALDFRDGSLVHDVIDDIQNRELSLKDVQPILVFKEGGKWKTWYNQRLYVLRVLEHRGIMEYAVAEVVSKYSRGYKAITTENGGRTVEARYSEVYDHGPLEVLTKDQKPTTEDGSPPKEPATTDVNCEVLEQSGSLDVETQTEDKANDLQHDIFPDTSSSSEDTKVSDGVSTHNNEPQGWMNTLKEWKNNIEDYNEMVEPVMFVILASVLLHLGIFVWQLVP
uniref:Uncharacterized LOC100185009 n=1 Tax=Ciona intestinalis TaxID=7719 RepID=A0A1W2WGL4_CIOIN|nr:uncharacterized protein LOC100185009 [Ciona intestinalis]|eukprot:XP_026694402.1 uncharacterized protein LOC100185009 [Ciona intestinalis]